VEYVEFHLDGLHAHHSTEDELIWPALHERASLSAALIDRMEAQHEGVADAMDATRRLLATWRESPGGETTQALAALLATISERLTEHLTEEERDVLPLIAEHISQAEWEHLGRTSFGKFTPKQRFVATGEMLATATPAEADRMMGGLPAPIRLVWWLVGRRSYDRFMSRVRG
jgi:hemerythrin-like domain-containing protein